VKGTKTSDSIKSALKDSIHSQQLTKQSIKQAELVAANEWKQKEIEQQKQWKSSEFRLLRITAIESKKKSRSRGCTTARATKNGCSEST
jgi:hypothetical protein